MKPPHTLLRAQGAQMIATSMMITITIKPQNTTTNNNNTF